MKIFQVLSLFFIFAKSYSSSSPSMKDPLKTIEDVADAAVQSIAKEVVDQVRKVVNISATLSQKVNDSSALGKIRNKLFDIEEDIVTGADKVAGIPINLKTITFYLVTAEDVENPKKVDFFKPEDVARTKGRIIFLIHGWITTINTSWYYDLPKIFIKNSPDTHTVLLDWDRPAYDHYIFSAFDTESIGKYIGDLISRLVSNYGVSTDSIIVIGHSLGAQIAGFACKSFTNKTGKKLSRIVALDPAGPLFILRPNSERLNKSDAEVVMAIHTDTGAAGYPTVIGTIDFFPNGGHEQPNCWKKLKAFNLKTYRQPISCDHNRSWEYFVEAVNITGSFPARKCDSYEDFKKGTCDGEVVMMGDLNTKATGSFFLETNSKKPYSKPLAEVINVNKN